MKISFQWYNQQIGIYPNIWLWITSVSKPLRTLFLYDEYLNTNDTNANQALVHQHSTEFVGKSRNVILLSGVKIKSSKTESLKLLYL